MKEISEALQVMKESGIIVYPTETSYGIGCNALNEEAVEKVYEAKQRPRSKPLTAICSSLEQAEKYCKLTEKERILVEEFMPGPLTLVVEKREKVPDNLNDKFVFRVSSSETARKLAEEFPIVATSANVSGNSTSYSVDDISEKLLDKVDYVFDVGKLEEGPTSTIAEIKQGKLVIHREGPITKSQLEKSLLDGS